MSLQGQKLCDDHQSRMVLLSYVSRNNSHMLSSAASGSCRRLRQRCVFASRASKALDLLSVVVLLVVVDREELTTRYVAASCRPGDK